MSSNDNNDKKFSNTVMPNDDSHAQKTSAGAPGIQIPKNAEDISEFTNVRKEDAQALNDRIKAKGHGAQAQAAEMMDNPVDQKKHEAKQKMEDKKAEFRDQQSDFKDQPSVPEQTKQGVAGAAESVSNSVSNAADKIQEKLGQK